MITYEKPIRIDEQTWRFRWSSDKTAPVNFRVYREGVKIAEWTTAAGVTTGQIDLMIPYGDFPFIEVLDDADAIPNLAFPGHITLHWQGVSGAYAYRVEEYVSAVWTLRQTVRDEGRGAFIWRSRWLEDQTAHQFRIVPVDAAGNQGTALSFALTMCRHPDIPSVSYAYNGAGTPTVTITAA